MEKFSRHTGLAAVLNRVNVDTDQIIPKEFLKRIERTGFGRYLFYDWRFDESGRLRPEFELNRPRFEGASILVAGDNFGCGSSREHAAWALKDYGFRVVIAPRFADIFYNNCIKNSLLPVALSPAANSGLIARIEETPGYEITADLVERTLTGSDGFEETFEIDAFRRETLLQGLDDIARTLKHEDAIVAFERRRGDFKEVL